MDWQVRRWVFGSWLDTTICYVNSYIGSHTIIELDKAAHSVVVVGYSVLDVVKAFEKVNGLKVPYVIKDCRPSDWKRSLISKICVAIAGIFRRIILTGTRSNYATR